MPEEFLDGQPDIAGNLAQQNRGNVSAWMIRNGRAPPVQMPLLHMRAPLPHQKEAQPFQQSAHLSRLQDRKFSHVLTHLYGLRAYELGFGRRGTVLKEHIQNLYQVAVQLVQ